jgi:glycerol-3-phosphate dehydrogenase (NAD(P)+)
MNTQGSSGHRVAVIGAGSWGTTVAHLCAQNVETTIWARQADIANVIANEHINPAYLSGCELSESLGATTDIEVAVAAASVVVMGVPSHGFRTVLADLVGHLRPGTPIVSLTKGVEQSTLLRMTEVIAEIAPGHPAGVLSGPNLAREVMAGHPAGSVLAFADENMAASLQSCFARPTFRVYVNGDVIGAETAGALKNVLAIAAGMVDGMGFGDNTKATLITRGLSEIARLGTQCGGRVLTFGGLAGLGDLIATCMSPLSRNRSVGEQIGRGRTIEEIVSEMNMVAEGVKSARPVWEKSVELGLDLPIVEQVMRVTHEGVSAQDALVALLDRPVAHELDW